ncbi:MAG: alpha-hydroxy-acid oxidizing protein [Candidatus Obscuribacterales bacterium]|nr:alpha-hydroxy-acid oxidizing protein [Candidatus Obscuribacterales bacterium]
MTISAEKKGEFKPVNLFEFEEQACSVVDKMAWDYYASGANDEITLRENRKAYERIFLYPRMLCDVSTRSLKTTVLGQEIQMPIMLAPTAFQKMAHADGELASARAASSAGTIMTLSTLATSSIEDVAKEACGNLWFQLYVYRDRNLSLSLVKRAEAAGYKALVLTVDSPLLGRRERDVRNGLHLPPDLKVANLIPAGVDALPESSGASGLASYIASLYDQSLTWKDLEWFVGVSSIPVLVKGILRADDAQRAIDCGAAGVIVSNHGGRQLDTAPATINVLERIVQVVDKRAEVFVDGGIRRGTDVLKALALGARAVLIGRPVLWGLACAGQSGVEEVLKLLRDELELAMALSGCASLADISSELLEP